MGRGRKPATGRFETREELCAWVWRWYLGTKASATDIAAQCGVTPPTVHKILNTREGYPEEKEVSKKIPLALPIRLGMANGFNANHIYDANDSAVCMMYGIHQHQSEEEVRKAERCAEGVAVADYMIAATNKHAAFVDVLESAIKTAEMERHPFRPWHAKARDLLENTSAPATQLDPAYLKAMELCRLMLKLDEKEGLSPAGLGHLMDRAKEVIKLAGE